MRKLLLYFLHRMPLFKDYGDNIAKWIQPPTKNQIRGWKWGTQGRKRWDNDSWRIKEFPEPTLQRPSKQSKPGENVYEGKNCLGLVFGWTALDSLSIPFLTISLEGGQKISKETLQAPIMNCFIVFVGGKYVNDEYSVVEKVEEITEEFYVSKPLMYFYESKKDEFGNDKYYRSNTPRVKGFKYLDR